MAKNLKSVPSIAGILFAAGIVLTSAYALILGSMGTKVAHQTASLINGQANTQASNLWNENQVRTSALRGAGFADGQITANWLSSLDGVYSYQGALSDGSHWALEYEFLDGSALSKTLTVGHVTLHAKANYQARGDVLLYTEVQGAKALFQAPIERISKNSDQIQSSLTPISLKEEGSRQSESPSLGVSFDWKAVLAVPLAIVLLAVIGSTMLARRKDESLESPTAPRYITHA